MKKHMLSKAGVWGAIISFIVGLFSFQIQFMIVSILLSLIVFGIGEIITILTDGQ